MTERQRYLDAVLFGNPDRIPLQPGRPRESTLGGVDKRALAASGEAMRAEVMRIVPPLLEQGGFIPGCDHGVPPDISWPNFVDYTRLLAQLTGWL